MCAGVKQESTEEPWNQTLAFSKVIRVDVLSSLVVLASIQEHQLMLINVSCVQLAYFLLTSYMHTTHVFWLLFPLTLNDLPPTPTIQPQVFTLWYVL